MIIKGNPCKYFIVKKPISCKFTRRADLCILMMKKYFYTYFGGHNLVFYLVAGSKQNNIYWVIMFHFIISYRFIKMASWIKSSETENYDTCTQPGILFGGLNLRCLQRMETSRNMWRWTSGKIQ